MSLGRRWSLVLAGLVVLRAVPPLVALAAEGHDVPGLPRFDLVAGTGDDAGFYAAAREFIAAPGRLPAVVLALLLLACAAAIVAVVRLWRTRPEWRPWVLLGAVEVAALAVTVVVLEMEPSGSAVFGWSLLWSVPLLPARLLGVASYEVAFAVGFPLLLVANAVAVVATAYAGLWATGRRAVGLVAAGALAVWPLVSVVVAGQSAWENGTWFVETGLALYTEPLSSALVAVALALLLRPRSSDLTLALAGLALSYASLVKISNALLAALAVLVVLRFRGVRPALPLALGALVLLPVALAYWPLGYVSEENGRNLLPPDPFSLSYAGRSWTESLLFSPRTLIVLLPLAIVGALAVRRREALTLLLAATLVNAAFYSFYAHTSLHPRFLFASLPPFFVLWAAGAVAVARRVTRA